MLHGVSSASHLHRFWSRCAMCTSNTGAYGAEGQTRRERESHARSAVDISWWPLRCHHRCSRHSTSEESLCMQQCCVRWRFARAQHNDLMQRFNPLSVFGKTSGKPFGSFWEGLGKFLGSCWEAHGKLLGNSQEAA